VDEINELQQVLDDMEAEPEKSEQPQPEMIDDHQAVPLADLSDIFMNESNIYLDVSRNNISTFMEAGAPQARNAEFDGEKDLKILRDLQSGISPQVQAMEQEKKKKEDEEENRQIQNTQTTKPAPKQMDIEQVDADVQQPQQNTTPEQEVTSQPTEVPARNLDDSDMDAAVLPSSQ